MDDLKVGMKETVEWEVTEKLTTARGEFKVFSTPSMCLLAEMACHKLITPHLKPARARSVSRSRSGTWQQRRSGKRGARRSARRRSTGAE